MRQKNRPSHQRFVAALEAINGNRTLAAKHFGVGLTTVHEWIADYKKHGLPVPKPHGRGVNCAEVYLPTSEEIAAATAAIRETWTREERYKRGGHKHLLEPYEIPREATFDVLDGRKRRRA